MKSPVLLCLETSASICSACIFDGESVSEKSVDEVNAHSRVLAPLVKELMESKSLDFNDLDGVVVSRGPGSYTGLRIGTSLAKGICYAKNIPLISVSTLKAIAVAAKEAQPASKYVSLIDARREDVYLGVFNPQFDHVIEEKFATLDHEVVSELNISAETALCGSGVSKFTLLFPDLTYINCSESEVYSRHLVELGKHKWKNQNFENLTSFEPNYIKSVFVTKPKPKF